MLPSEGPQGWVVKTQRLVCTVLGDTFPNHDNDSQKTQTKRAKQLSEICSTERNCSTNALGTWRQAVHTYIVQYNIISIQRPQEDDLSTILTLQPLSLHRKAQTLDQGLCNPYP